MKELPQEKLKKHASTIYGICVESFVIKEGGKKQPTAKSGESRRERMMKQLIKEKNLQKQWKQSKPEEKESLFVLYEYLMKKCHNMLRNLRRVERRNESKTDKRTVP